MNLQKTAFRKGRRRMLLLRKARTFAFAAACLCATSASALAASAALTYGIASYSFTYAPLYVAEDAGIFKKEGLDISGELMSGSGVEATATIAGNLPFYVGLSQTAALAIAKGQKLETFAEVSQQFPMDVVVSKEVAQKLGLTRKTSVDARLNALKGLRIAAWTPGGGPDMLIHFIIAEKGWNAQRDLTILPVGPAMPMMAALQNDRIDGFVFSSPSSDEAVSRLGAFILYRGAKGSWAPLKDAVFNCLIANPDWLAANKSEAALIYRGLALAMNFMRAHPNETKAILRKRLNMFSDADFQAGYKNLYYMIPETPEVGPVQANRIWNFMKTIDPSFSVPAAELTNPEIGVLASQSPH
jgi:NitT/TauT family transport system substrate-binding protein